MKKHLPLKGRVAWVILVGFVVFASLCDYAYALFWSLPQDTGIEDLAWPNENVGLAVDKYRNWHIVYFDDEGRISYRNSYGGYSVLARDSVWDNPQIAIDSAGGLHVMFVQSTPCADPNELCPDRLMYTRNLSGTWSLPQDTGIEDLAWPNENIGLAVDKYRNWHIVYEEHFDPNANDPNDDEWRIIYRNSYGGYSILARDGVWDNPQIAIDPAGGLHVMYGQSTPCCDRLMYTRNLSGTWSLPQDTGIEDLAWPTENVGLAVDKYRNWHIVYFDDEWRISYRNSYGGYSILARDSVWDNPQIAIDSAGGLHVMYSRWTPCCDQLVYTHSGRLAATNLWDGKNIKLEWDNRLGPVKIFRKKENSSYEFIKTVSSSPYIDAVPEPGKNYTYQLRTLNGITPLTPETTVKAEVIVVLVRGYDGNPWGGVDPGYWKPDKHPCELVDVNNWFTQNGVTCWVPPQGKGIGQGLSGCKSVEDNTRELENFIENKRTGSYKNAKINLVGHSMGGLISRKYAHDRPGIVNNIFAVQTPHTGSPLADIGIYLTSNPATFDLMPIFAMCFNVLNNDISGTRLYSFWSGNYTNVFNDLSLKICYGYMRDDPRFLGAGNDGAVPVLSATGYIWNCRNKDHTTLDHAVKIDASANTSLDHLSGYRAPSTLQQIMSWMGLPYQQTKGLSMPFEALTEESNESPMTPQHFVAGFEGQCDSNTPVTKAVPIVNSTLAYFEAITSDVNCSFTLTDPCGTIYDPNYALSAPDVNYETESGMFLYEVNSPIRGIWTLNLSTTVSSPNTVNYGLTVFEDANIALYAYTNSDWANTNANVLILARLAENNNPIIDANVTAEIVLPDTNTVLVSLYDDGLHNDVNANDGVYANIFTSTTQTGIYTGHVTAKGSSVYGGFERTSPMSFTISLPDINFAGDINDVGVDLNGNGLYDKLKFTVPVNVSEANSFLLTATLSDSNDNIIKMLTTGEVNLPAGPNNLILRVSAEEIVRHGVNGPYKLSNITIYDVNGLIIAVHPDCNTAAYLVSNFEPLDTDHDGLPDNLERLIGTDVNLPDSDFDGVTDYNEIRFDGDANSYNPATDLNPLNPDTDNDGMSDGWEIYFGYDPLHDNGEKDNDDDSDGLTNLQEYQNNTDPDNPDTDADGMPDGWEVRYGFNPSYDSGEGNNDDDSDGLTNLAEFQNGTLPNNPDTDGDGVLDGSDNCKLMYNPEQADADGDGKGDTCEADISGNSEVDLVDFALLASHWLESGCGNCGGADLDNEEDVDFADLDILAENWLAGTK